MSAETLHSIGWEVGNLKENKSNGNISRGKVYGVLMKQSVRLCVHYQYTSIVLKILKRILFIQLHSHQSWLKITQP